MNPEDLRATIPLLRDHAYLDSAATSLKPASVLEAMTRFYQEVGANVDRGAHGLGSEATERLLAARQRVAQGLFGVPPEELVFTYNATEALNTLAFVLAQEAADGAPLLRWRPRDVILTTVFEHHSNFLPWQRLAKWVGAEFRVVRPRGNAFKAEDFDVRGNVRVLAIQHASNVTGHLHPLREIAARVKRDHPGALVLADGAQVAGHRPLDVPSLGVDAYVFAGHKGPLGPQGVGGFWARRALLDPMPPFRLGGGTIVDVQEHSHKLRPEGVARMEGGSPNTAGAIGLAEGVRILTEDVGLAKVQEHERALTRQLREGLEGLGATIVGPSDVGVVSFNLQGWSCHDVGLALDKARVAVRTGHHCGLPLSRHLGTLEPHQGTVRASVHYYNTPADIERCLEALRGLVR